MARDLTAAMAEQQQKIEQQVGEPLAACLVGLSGSGATAASSTSLLSGGLGWFMRDRANEKAAGAATISFTKNRYAVLTLTPANELNLYSAKISKGGYEIEKQIGSWDRADLDIAIDSNSSVYKVTISGADLTAPIELEITRMQMAEIVGGFANKLGVPV